MQKFSSKMTASTLAISAALFVLPSAAMAQESSGEQTEESSSRGLDFLDEAIVVTGTKKAGGENVQDASASIVAFGTETLEALQVRDISSLSFNIPNVSLEDIGTTKGVANFQIRGLAVNSSIPSVEPAVGTTVDGVYLGINGGVVFDTFDLAGVEVLRGPQGVLFGRNVSGGALVLNTTDPLNELRVTAKVAAESGLRGTGGNYTAQGSITGPIIKDVLSAKIALYYNEDDGWFENSLADVVGTTATLNGQTENFGISDTFIARAAIKLTPSDFGEFLLKFEHGESDGQGPAAQNRADPGAAPSAIVSFAEDSFDFAIDERGFSDSEWNQLTFQATADIGIGTLTNIFGWREYSQSARTDLDSTPLNLLHFDFATEQNQISNELRFNGQFGDIIDLTAGLYYFSQEITYAENRDLLGQLTPTGDALVQQTGGGVLDQETIGIFASLDINVTDRFTINAGLRYSDETKDANLASILGANAGCNVIAGTCPFDITDSFSTSNFSPKLGVKYEVSDSARIYAHWARAFRAGGFNLRNTSTDIVNNGPQFDDERIDSFEFGVKSEPFDRGRVNFAAFYNRLDNLQRDVLLLDGANFVQIIRNATDATIWGFEIDGQVEVAPGVLIEAALGYVDNNYRNVTFDLTGDGVIDGADEDLQLPRLSNFTSNVSLIVEQEIGFGTLTGRASYSHRDRAAGVDNNLLSLPSNDRIDASLSLALPGDQVRLTLYGKNLTNEVSLGGIAPLPGLAGPVPLAGTLATLKKGRVFGIEIGFSSF